MNLHTRLAKLGNATFEPSSDEWIPSISDQQICPDAIAIYIINGKVIQEGQEIAPGFKLETIGQRSAVLNHQGLRYSIGY